MAKTLEQFTAEAMSAYQPAKQSIQTQLGSLDSNRNTALGAVDRNYQQRQAQLENQRNQAAESASMQAAGSGGSFGGAANLANRKYYEKSFIPAQTQLQTDKSNEIAQINQNFENQRTNLNSQLSNMDATANQMALQQYWAQQEAEANRAAQAAQNNAYYKYLMDAMNAQGTATQPQVNKQDVNFIDWVKGYSNYDQGTKDTIVNGIGSVPKMGNNLFSRTLYNALSNTLPSSQYYKDYENWRNS